MSGVAGWHTRHTVYAIFGDETLLYVGVSVNPVDRLNSHQRLAWWPDVTGVVFEHFENRQEALGRERYLIQECHPIHNKLGRMPVVPTLPDLPCDDGVMA